MFFFDVQPGTQRHGYSPAKQTGFDNGMAHAVFPGSMMMYLADRLHLLGPLDRLSVVDNQQTVFASFFEETG